MTEFDTPCGVPPFDRIRAEHFRPAFEAGIRQSREEVTAIARNAAPATFENTVEALESSGALLRRVSSIFFDLNAALTSDAMQQVAREVAPLLSSHADDILMDPALFARVETIYRRRESLDLTPEQRTLLREQYEDFVRSGARLRPDEQAVLRGLNQRLSLLSVQFGENVLKETNAFSLCLSDRADLAGLPDRLIAEAAEAARERGEPGKWLFSLQRPSLIPFLQYSERRELRRQIFEAYIRCGDNGNGWDNNAIAHEIATLRAERTHLLGYAHHAAFVLEKSMAETPEEVRKLLGDLWGPALDLAKQEAAAIRELIRAEGHDFDLEPWDWWYYAEKIRKERFDLDDEVLRPYFPLEPVRDGAFAVAHRLYGIEFRERPDLPTYHDDVRVFEVREADGSFLGILYLDYFPRDTKRAGAWMNAYRKQSGAGTGAVVSPVVSNVCNFSRPATDRPALLTLEEVETLFHEFGHALHGLLSRCRYDALSGTSVPRDFVELPSQIMENWATHPDVLRSYARHYVTGAAIPDALIEKIQNARRFNQGFALVEYLAAAFLDLDWHTWTGPITASTREFEAASLARIGLIPEIVVRYRSPYFSHIFSGGYAAGYYSYIWAEVLDADAFQAFEERGLFDPETAQAFREHILARGGSERPMELYRRFRGADPALEPLLRRKGLLREEEFLATDDTEGTLGEEEEKCFGHGLHG